MPINQGSCLKRVFGLSLSIFSSIILQFAAILVRNPIYMVPEYHKTPFSLSEADAFSRLVMRFCHSFFGMLVEWGTISSICHYQHVY